MAVCPVPLEDIREHLIVGLRRSPLLQLLHAALGPNLRRGRQEDLYLRLRQHYRANVTTVHHHTVAAGQLPLHLQQKGPYLRDGGDHRGPAGDFRTADDVRHVLPVEQHTLQAVLTVGHAHLNVRQQGDDGRQIMRVCLPAAGVQADGAVDGPGIHVEDA